jgi:transposase-like protein
MVKKIVKVKKCDWCKKYPREGIEVTLDGKTAYICKHCVRQFEKIKRR